MLIEEMEMWKKDFFPLHRKSHALEDVNFCECLFDFLNLYNSFHLRKKYTEQVSEK